MATKKKPETIETATAQQPSEDAAMPKVHIRFLRSNPRFAHFAGDPAEYPEHIANELIEGGFAERIEEKEVETTEE